MADSKFGGLLVAIKEDLENQWEEREIVRKSIGASMRPGEKLPLMPSDMFHAIKYVLEVHDTSAIHWLVEKKLEKSDVKRQLSRLFIPAKDKFDSILSMEEQYKAFVDKKAHKRGGLNVIVVDHKGEIWKNFAFKCWSSLKQYALASKKWVKFTNKHELQKGDVVQIWFFQLPTLEKDGDRKHGFGINITKKEADNVGGNEGIASIRARGSENCSSKIQPLRKKRRTKG